jgi:hypothetical protein
MRTVVPRDISHQQIDCPRADPHNTTACLCEAGDSVSDVTSDLIDQVHDRSIKSCVDSIRVKHGALHSEIADNCREHAHQIKQLLAAECPLCINGESICPVREYAKEVARESL